MPGDTAGPATDDEALLPLFLKLAGRVVLVVGAGPVGQGKIESLLETGARIRVVAPEGTDRVRQLAEQGQIEWTVRAFEDVDADEAWLAFAATSDPRVQQQVAAAMGARRRFCVAVDDPAHASAYSGGLVRRPPFTIAISSGGAAPALTRLLREVIEHVLPGPDWVEHARRLRAKWLAEGTPMADRFAELVRDVKKGP